MPPALTEAGPHGRRASPPPLHPCPAPWVCQESPCPLDGAVHALHQASHGPPHNTITAPPPAPSPAPAAAHPARSRSRVGSCGREQAGKGEGERRVRPGSSGSGIQRWGAAGNDLYCMQAVQEERHAPLIPSTQSIPHEQPNPPPGCCARQPRRPPLTCPTAGPPGTAPSPGPHTWRPQTSHTGSTR